VQIALIIETEVRKQMSEDRSQMEI